MSKKLTERTMTISATISATGSVTGPARLREPVLDRRALFGLGGGALALLPIVGCKGGDDAKKREADDKARREADEANDVELFNKGILMEQGAVNVYKAAAGLPFIAENQDILPIASQFMSNHQEHIESLIKWVETLGGKPVDPGGAKTPDIPPDILNESLEVGARTTAVLQFARSLEKQAADAYFKLLVEQLQTEFARRSAAEIVPVEAQHVAVYDVVLKSKIPANAGLFSHQS